MMSKGGRMNRTLGLIRGKVRYAILVVLVATVTAGFAHAFRGGHGGGGGGPEPECQWTDSFNNELGPVVTFSPPDTPTSLGYCCGGDGCLYYKEERGFFEGDCVVSPAVHEGEGVYSQACACQVPPPWF